MRNLTSGRKKLVVLAAFGACCLAVIASLLSLSGVKVSDSYQVSVVSSDVDNLVPRGRVRIAGVTVGYVETTEVTPEGAKAVISLLPEYAPLHEGATVRIGNRSLVEETYLELKDGTGRVLSSGTALPADAVRTSTQVSDVLHSLDQPTRKALTELLRSSGQATSATRAQTAQLLAGLGDLGRDGVTALDAIAAQSADLQSLARDTSTILKALDTGQGQIAALVDSADRLTAASASQRTALAETMRRLPGVLESATTASVKLTALSGSLQPVARDLRAAGPKLSSALAQLPAASRDLRGLLPELNAVLDTAPATLDRIPQFADDMRDELIPSARDILQDVNPILGYLKPYGPDIAAFLANFNAILNYKDEAGNHYWRTFLTVNDKAVTAPASLGLTYYNPIPAAGSGGLPGPFKGEFPRLERQPR
ncbi:MlaD family protein [Nocardioides sp. GCM10030258]|uniref:MlaD family protein n=1 Tax=unclassified Nocardioides TaxID=2615069 RepID=UPI003622CE30